MAVLSPYFEAAKEVHMKHRMGVVWLPHENLINNGMDTKALIQGKEPPLATS